MAFPVIVLLQAVNLYSSTMNNCPSLWDGTWEMGDGALGDSNLTANEVKCQHVKCDVSAALSVGLLRLWRWHSSGTDRCAHGVDGIVHRFARAFLEQQSRLGLRRPLLSMVLPVMRLRQRTPLDRNVG